MSKLIAFLSYGMNAGVMLTVALLLARTLTAAEYSRYSFAVASAQMLAVCTFEWLRMAATRYYPGPVPGVSAHLRGALLGGQHIISLCALVVAFLISLIAGDLFWFLITCYAILQSLVDLQFTMLRFAENLRLFSRLQTIRGIVTLILAISAALVFRHASAALMGGMLANILTILVLEVVQPGFVLIVPSRGHIAQLRKMASYGFAAATAGGLYQFGPFLMRCVAFRGASATSYASFSLVTDLMQRPYNVALSALNGVFFPDAVREHDQSPKSDRDALRLLYAIQVWCLLLIFGAAMGFRNELIPLLVKSGLVSDVLDVFPFLSAFYLIHGAIQTTSALALHLARAGDRLIIQAATELVAITTLTGLGSFLLGSGIIPVACGGMFGALAAFLLNTRTKCPVPCRLPWKSWTVALISTGLLVLIGQINTQNGLTGVCFKALLVCPIIVIGGYAGVVLPFGLVEKRTGRRTPVVRSNSPKPIDSSAGEYRDHLKMGRAGVGSKCLGGEDR